MTSEAKSGFARFDGTESPKRVEQMMETAFAPVEAARQALNLVTTERLLAALDAVSDYPRLLVETAIAEERQRILDIVQPSRSGRSHNVWWFRAVVKGKVSR